MYNEIIEKSGYHLQDITAFVNSEVDLAICDYSIAVFERYLHPIEYLGGIGRKECERWEDDMVYGIPGVVGRWNSEIN